ncbi:MAG: LysM peptidoglycan-binding domain-containing protein, partial [Methylococcaceae bacterium]|nr:LysM peptidoglycan-binding domain-containing protein [Methylococcaceae bacterium]
MAFLKKLGLVATLLFCINVWAGEEPPEIKSDRPDSYTVVRGDTLWDISAKYLKSPWQWPRLWRGNPQVENPHLIYPGDVLTFSMVDGQPVVTLRRGRDVKLYPRKRVEDLEEAIKTIPTDAIAQFLNAPKVVSETEIDESPYVLEFPDEHLMVGAGDRLYVRSIRDPKSLNYTIYRKGQTYRHAQTNKLLGYEAMYVADARLDKEGEVATLTIVKSGREVLIGDRLMENAKG